MVIAVGSFSRPTTSGWSADRAEHSLSDSHSRDLVAAEELALDKDGRFLGLRVKAEANYGAYLSMFAPSIPTTGMARVISGLYHVPAIYIDFDCAFTNTVPVDAIRGAGKPETILLLERFVDLAAQETGRSPIELRRLNLLTSADMPYQTATGYTYDAVDFPPPVSTSRRGGSTHAVPAADLR